MADEHSPNIEASNVINRFVFIARDYFTRSNDTYGMQQQ